MENTADLGTSSEKGKNKKTRAHLKRITLRGVVCGADEKGRLRFSVADTKVFDLLRAACLQRCGASAETAHPLCLPYRLSGDALGGANSWAASSANVEHFGAFWATPPARHCRHWLAVAEEQRGVLMKVEVCPRHYSFVSPQNGRVEGVALDLHWMEPDAPEATSKK